MTASKPARGRKLRAEAPSVMVGVKISPEEKAKYLAASKELKVSFSQWIRQAMAAAAKIV